MIDPLEDGPRAVQLLGHYVDEGKREMYEAWADCNLQEDAAVFLPAEVSRKGIVLPDEIIEMLKEYAKLTNSQLLSDHAEMARQTLAEQEKLRAAASV